MPIFADLVEKGFFPKELPPCFSSKLYGAICQFTTTFPPEFSNPTVSKCIPYSYARGGVGTLRRHLSILNPVNFYAIAECIATNWLAINAHISSAHLSFSRPIHNPGGERALSTYCYAKRFLVEPRARNRSIARVFLLADISQFYHSIYTHSIAWAFHTRAVAKKNHSQSLFGNRLDKLVQNAQDGQTRGIPIGPDSSLVIAEAVLARVELEVAARIPKLAGLRYIDDYELCFPDYAGAEIALSVLQEELQQFELQLNPSKTKLQSPPVRFEPEWVAEFRTFTIRTNSGQYGDLVRYFDLISSYVISTHDEHVAKYAASKMVLNKFVPEGSTTNLYQALLCQLLIAQPSASKEIVDSFLIMHHSGCPLDTVLINACFSEVITKAAPLGHHYEVSWLLYGLLTLGLGLLPPAVASLGRCDNAIIGLMALNAFANGLAPGLDASIWSSHMTTQDLRGEYWILSYEASHHGWLRSANGRDHIASDSAFSFLRSQGLSFYAAI